MGMFDHLEVQLELPELPKDFKAAFQTKSLDCTLDNYRIDPDGLLWHKAYDIEDRSDPDATGFFARFAGMMTRINERWEKLDYTGEIRFYDADSEYDVWYEYSAYFEHGQLVRGPHRTEDR